MCLFQGLRGPVFIIVTVSCAYPSSLDVCFEEPLDGTSGVQPADCQRTVNRLFFQSLLLIMQILHYLIRTLNCGKYGILLIPGNAGFISSTVGAKTTSSRALV